MSRLSPAQELVLIGSITWFLSSGCLPATDFFVAPEANGRGDGTSWDDAIGPDKAQQFFNDVLRPGERLLISGGDYPGFSMEITTGGTPGKPKSLVGVDRGGGLPRWRGDWSVEEPASGKVGVRIRPGLSDLVIENLHLEAYLIGIEIPEADPPVENTRIQFRNCHLERMRYGFFLHDSRTMILTDCRVSRYTKHGFRFEAGCHEVTLTRCKADCSQGDPEWENLTELFPFVFLVNESERPHTGFLFEDCIASNHLMPRQQTSYKNGDGFVIEASVSGVSFIGCRALRNQDGGFDVKSALANFKNCSAVKNSRGYRIWGQAVFDNCTVADGNTGIWSNGSGIEVTRMTFENLTGTAVMTDDDASGVVRVRDSLLIRCAEPQVNTAGGTVTFEKVTVKENGEI